MHIQKLLKNNWAVILFLGMINGAASTLSIEPFNFPLTVWISLWPLFYLAERFRDSKKMLIWSGISAAFFSCLFGFHWIIHLFNVYGGIPIYISLLLFIPYSILLNLKLPLFLLLYGLSFRIRYKKYLPSSWLVAAFIATFLDLTTPQIFMWYWGNLLSGNPYLSQFAEIAGVYGLTFLLFLIDAALYRILRIRPLLRNIFETRTVRGSHLTVAVFRRFFENRYVIRRILFVPLILALLAAYGIYRKERVEALQESLPRVTVASIQPNTPLQHSGEGKTITEELIHEIVTRTIPNLAESAALASNGRLDLIVVPESAVPYSTTDDNYITRRLGIYNDEYRKMAMLLAHNWNADVLINESTVQVVTGPDGKPVAEPYNSAALFARDGRTREVFHKRILVAFGEYIPGFDIIEALGLTAFLPEPIRFFGFRPGRISNAISFSRENTEKPFAHPSPLHNDETGSQTSYEFASGYLGDRSFRRDGTFIPLICYEILEPEHVRSFFNENQDPGFLVNITQDEWYGHGIETYQHFETGRIRAIEFRRAIVRSTNSGSSGFIDPAGNYVTPDVGPVLTEQGVRAFQVWEVPILTDYRTLYARFGNLWFVFPILFLTGSIIRKYLRKKRRQLSENRSGS
jgi:apolipoprotein N-acyltransferase